MFTFFLDNISFLIDFWLPWVTILSENFFLQIALVYLVYLIFTTLNIYYVLVYIFIEIFLFGLFISLIQMELFTGFLWVVECTVIFIALLLLFFLNVEGLQLRINFKNYRLYFVFFLFLLFLVSYSFFFFTNFEGQLPILFNSIDLWENFYEALHNINMNDFRALSISYYIINSIEFLLIGFILLVGSVVCVNLNKLQKHIRIYKYTNYFNIFNFYKDYLNYTFIRKQNLMVQNTIPASIRIFKKK